MLERILLVNFKAFDELELPLSPLTLLSGLNGSGKSTVLQAFGLLRQSFDAGFLSSGTLALNGEYTEVGTGSDLLYQKFEAPELEIELRCTAPSGSCHLRWHAPVSAGDDVLACSAFPDTEELSVCSLFNRGFQFIRADRITPSVTFPKSQNAVRQHGILGSRGEYTAHFLLELGEDLKAPKALQHPETSDGTSLISQVNAWMQDFSPGARVAASSIPMTDFVRLLFTYRGQGAAYGDPLRPTNVGFGLTHALPVLTACLAAEPGTLIGIENPEAQLHPRGQAAMGLLLALTAANGVQVVVETHSDHVLNGIRLAIKDGRLSADKALFHFFRRNPGEASTFETPSVSAEGRLSYWPDGFFDQWERSLDQLLD